MKRYTVNDFINVYEANPVKEMRFIKKLANMDFVIVYDKQILEHEEKILLVPIDLNLYEVYRIIKEIYPYSYVVKNLKEIGWF